MNVHFWMNYSCKDFFGCLFLTTWQIIGRSELFHFHLYVYKFRYIFPNSAGIGRLFWFRFVSESSQARWGCTTSTKTWFVKMNVRHHVGASDHPSCPSHLQPQVCVCSSGIVSCSRSSPDTQTPFRCALAFSFHWGQCCCWIGSPALLKLDSLSAGPLSCIYDQANHLSQMGWMYAISET